MFNRSYVLLLSLFTRQNLCVIYSCATVTVICKATHDMLVSLAVMYHRLRIPGQGRYIVRLCETTKPEDCAAYKTIGLMSKETNSRFRKYK